MHSSFSLRFSRHFDFTPHCFSVNYTYSICCSQHCLKFLSLAVIGEIQPNTHDSAYSWQVWQQITAFSKWVFTFLNHQSCFICRRIDICWQNSIRNPLALWIFPPPLVNSSIFTLVPLNTHGQYINRVGFVLFVSTSLSHFLKHFWSCMLSDCCGWKV